MNILIAHPKLSFIEATTQMLLAQNANYKIVGAQSLSDLVEKMSLDFFHVYMIDSELGKNNSTALLRILEALKDESFVIVLLREGDEILQQVINLGIQEKIFKSSGYLVSITNAVQRAFEAGSPRTKATKAAAAGKAASVGVVASHTGSSITSNDKVMATQEDGFFVCDRRGRYLSVNSAFESISRYTQQELLQLSILDIIADAQSDENYMRKLFDVSMNQTSHTIEAHILDKYGERHPCLLYVRVLRDESSQRELLGFQVTVKPVSPSIRKGQSYQIDQSKLVAEFANLVHLGYSEPLNIFLRRIIEVTCQAFKFKRSTLALLDHRRNVFVKQAMVGYSENEGRSIERRTLEVPSEVIDRIFEDRYRIKVIYYNQDQRELTTEDNPGVPERRTQRRRPLNEWHKRDLVLLNLKDSNGRPYGYISLDEPQDGTIPSRSTFHNLELVSRLVSMAIENYYRFSLLDKKNRRLKQILSNSNIFKLHLSLTELLNEMVWSAKYSMDFNLVTLVLISKKTQMLETKAVACDDKIKQTQLLELTFDIHDFSNLLREEYQVGQSYLISREEFVLEHFKQIYYGAETSLNLEEGWPTYALLLVPIRGRDEKIIGFFMADDPQDTRFPTPETVHTLEILANQIAIAIDNRIMYVQAKEPSKNGGNGRGEHYGLLDTDPNAEYSSDDFSKGGFKKIVERFLR
ncbi:GAF domain-containing protein [candidate division KSB1 bacterium]|nr:GAF domain-containing protein [candidate division KSB1 bacterium]